MEENQEREVWERVREIILNLAYNLRIDILRELSKAALTVPELDERLRADPDSIYYHLFCLQKIGLVRVIKNGEPRFSLTEEGRRIVKSLQKLSKV